MFFFIAGVQPKTVDIEGPSGLCPGCGLRTLGLKRVDHYLSVFFLPIIRVKKGMPFRVCRSCGRVSGEPGESLSGGAGANRLEPVCPHCGGAVDASFRYCPYCGRPVS
jgi:hypothetical protein